MLPSPSSVQANSWLTEKWGFTQSKVINIRYKWTIDNFSLRSEKSSEFVQSPVFSAGSNDEMQWCLKIYPNLSEYVTIYLRLQSLTCNRPVGTLKFSILNAKGEETNVMASKEIQRFNVNEDRGFQNFIGRSFLLDKANLLLPEDKLTVLCAASIIADSADISGECVKFTVPECKLAEDLSNLFIKEDFSDVTLEVAGREIKAHKAILSARSDVFAAMFTHNLEEKKQNRVVITDVEYEVLEEILRFIYTGKVSSLEKYAKDLLAAADKYALHKLKVMSEAMLFSNLSFETASETLILAHLHSSTKLKEATIDFIRCHVSDVMNTNGWQNLTKSSSHSSLLVDIIQAPAMQKLKDSGGNETKSSKN